MTNDLLNNVLDTFKTHGNAPDLHAKALVFGGEVQIVILAPSMCKHCNDRYRYTLRNEPEFCAKAR